MVHSNWKTAVAQIKDVLLSDDQEVVELPVGTGEEAALLEVIREYRERTREKMRAMEERYQHDLIAREEGSNKKLQAADEGPCGSSSEQPKIDVQQCSELCEEGPMLQSGDPDVHVPAFPFTWVSRSLSITSSTVRTCTCM